MKPVAYLINSVVLSLAVGSAYAQAVKGNEAVAPMSGGTRKVDLPPLTATAEKAKPCKANAGCHAGPWHMVETDAGLQECTEPFARAGTCRASTYGEKKASRLWIVKKGAAWLWCQYPDMGSICVDMNARPPKNLPTSAVQ